MLLLLTILMCDNYKLFEIIEIIVKVCFGHANSFVKKNEVIEYLKLATQVLCVTLNCNVYYENFIWP